MGGWGQYDTRHDRWDRFVTVGRSDRRNKKCRSNEGSVHIIVRLVDWKATARLLATRLIARAFPLPGFSPWKTAELVPGLPVKGEGAGRQGRGGRRFGYIGQAEYFIRSPLQRTSSPPTPRPHSLYRGRNFSTYKSSCLEIFNYRRCLLSRRAPVTVKLSNYVSFPPHSWFRLVARPRFMREAVRFILRNIQCFGTKEKEVRESMYWNVLCTVFRL